MKSKLELITQRLIALRDEAPDDQIDEALDNILLNLEEISDRLIAIEQEESQPDDAGYDELKADDTRP
jgi:hypothetical protein